MDRNEWIKVKYPGCRLSLSARRAWIEIPAGCWRDARRAVALRKESVDRNYCSGYFRFSRLVALRKESVDRNHKDLTQWFRDYGSLSARRAWIEILFRIGSRSQKPNVALRKESVDRNHITLFRQTNICVALRKESVDRNKRYIINTSKNIWSLSARRAWIEICYLRSHRPLK